jgi:hypothetical protein
MRTGVMAGPEHKQMSETTRLLIRGSCIQCCCSHGIANRGGGASGGETAWHVWGGLSEQEGGGVPVFGNKTSAEKVLSFKFQLLDFTYGERSLRWVVGVSVMCK